MRKGDGGIMSHLFKIGVLAKMTGVSTRSIRHYEKMGLITSPDSTDSNYRLFSEVELKRLKQIRLLRELNFSLDEIQEIFTLNENVEIASIFEKRLAKMEQEVAEITKKRDLLDAVVKIYKSSGSKYIDDFHIMKEIVTMNNKFNKIFNELDVQLQITILKELYQTGTMQPETIKAIGATSGTLFLDELHLMMVKALLDGVDMKTEINIVETLRKDDPEFAQIAMNAMFTFSDFARLPDEVIKEWAKHCKDDELVIALRDSNKYLQNKVLMNLEESRSKLIKVKIDEGEVISLDQSFQAMSNLIDILRELERSGNIMIERFEY